MSTKRQTFHLLTPCFCAGISKSRPEMRLASIRGQLRWWARVLHGTGTPEYKLFGGIHGTAHGYAEEAVASSFKFGLSTLLGNPAPALASLVPHYEGTNRANGFRAMALAPRSCYTLAWAAQPHPDFRDKAGNMINGHPRCHYLEQALKAWLLLGTIGRRGTRAAGSVWPVGYAPTVESFQKTVMSLAIPAAVKVAVLTAVDNDPEILRAIADLTVHGLKRDGAHLRPDESSIAGDPLGYVDRSDRKASPLRFKVGHFADGYRLIAVWDNRGGRGNNLTGAIAALNAPGNGHRLGALLAAATWI